MNKNNKKNTRVFTIIALFIPLIFFLLLESFLHLSGYGRNFPLFVENPQFPQSLHINPRIIERYFPRSEMAPKVRPDIILFDKTKSADTFRIVVQGGSSAAGFPYGRNASLAGMLNQRFKRLYPEKKIEIISTAMAAVNSYAMLDFVDEIIEQKPDLVVIYAGHNEYLGVMGVASNYASIGGRAATLAYIKLRSLKFYQLLEKIFYHAKESKSPTKDQRSLMSKIARGKYIPLESDLFVKGQKQFSGNLASILNKYHNKGIPVIVSTLVSNEKDQPPFSTIDRVDWAAYLDTLSADTAHNNIADLIKIIETQADAENHYKLGLNYYQKDFFLEARKHFIQARDYDQLRFRAPSVFNTIITEQSKKNGAILVNAESLFLSDSEENIIGKTHMLEHLHPNERGYFLLAETFSKAIVDSELIDKNAKIYSQIRAWSDNPLTELDILEGEHTIRKLTNDYPFKPLVKVENLAVADPPADTIAGRALALKESGVDWISFQQQLIIEYQTAGNIKEAARIAANTSDALNKSPQTAVFAGNLYAQRKDYDMAIFYFRRAVRLAPQNRDYLLALAKAYFAKDDKHSSAKVLEKIKKLGN